jgi:hypothetical protein
MYKNMFKLRLKSLFFVSLLALVLPSISLAQASVPLNRQNNSALDLSAYRQVKTITGLNILVPTVIEIPFTETNLERSDFMVVDEMSKSALPYYFKTETAYRQAYYTAQTIPSSADYYKMTDNNSRTYAEFNLQGEEANVVTVNLYSDQAITSTALTTLLDANVALPTTIEIYAKVGGAYKTVLASTKMSQQTVKFPETTASEWRIVFNYAQPLRISELRLVQNNVDKISQNSIRFLAQPNGYYKIYFDPDRSVVVSTSEAGNLISDEDVLLWGQVVTTPNSFYKKADVDQDNVPDYIDNCVSIYNPEQTDINNNGRGDACDDYDKDGLNNEKDNCPNIPNLNQKDIDHDGIGDACDSEESRITEKYKWIPWLGIVFALGVIIVLFLITLKSKKPLN